MLRRAFLKMLACVPAIGALFPKKAVSDGGIDDYIDQQLANGGRWETLPWQDDAIRMLDVYYPKTGNDETYKWDKDRNEWSLIRCKQMPYEIIHYAS